MGTRAALIVAAALAASGCSAFGNAGYGGQPVDMGAGGWSDMGTSACAHLEIARPAANATLPVTVQVTLSNTHNRDHWTWSLSRFGGVPPAFDVPPDSTVATFTLTEYDTYTFGVTFTQPLCLDPSSESQLTIHSPVVGANYYLRALPPESSGFAPFQRSFPVYDNSPQSDVNLDIGVGVPISASLQSATGASIPGNVRFVATDPSWVDALAATKPFPLGAFTSTLYAAGDYQAVVIPDSSVTGLAPGFLLDPMSGKAAVRTGAAWASGLFIVPAGVVVSGSVGDGTKPIVGARVALRAGVLPSTLGTSGSDGSFSLRAQSQQQYALTVVGDDWPEATAGKDSPFTLPDSGAAVTVTYAGARTPVTGTVFASDGVTPLKGARVTISLPDAPAAPTKVGTVRVDAAGVVTLLDAFATGSRVVYSGDGGALPAMHLPSSANGYRILVEPPANSSSGSSGGISAYTRGSADLPWKLALQPKVDLHVTVTRADGQELANGFAVSAVAAQGLHPIVLANPSGDPGRYTLPLDPGPDWTVIVEPLSFSDRLLEVRQLVKGGSSSTAVVMPPGLGIGGLVSYNGTAAASVRIEVLCKDGCSPPGQLLADGITGVDGHYRVYLPNPAPVAADMGMSDGGSP